MSPVKICLADSAEVAGIGSWLKAEIMAFNEAKLGPHPVSHIASVAKVGDQIVGGMFGIVVLDWLSVEVVFVSEEFRGQRFGESLLQTLEEEGRRLGARRAFVDTTSFQAEGFYAKYGYVEWGRFRDFAPGVDRIYMRKDSL
jgi:GNAT superfamily N-acetyltransferase